MLCGLQSENLPFLPKFVSDPQKWQFGDLTKRDTFPQTPPFLDASSIKEIILLALIFATGSSSNKSRTARNIWILSSWQTESSRAPTCLSRTYKSGVCICFTCPPRCCSMFNPSRGPEVFMHIRAPHPLAGSTAAWLARLLYSLLSHS